LLHKIPEPVRESKIPETKSVFLQQSKHDILFHSLTYKQKWPAKCD